MDNWLNLDESSEIQIYIVYTRVEWRRLTYSNTRHPRTSMHKLAHAQSVVRQVWYVIFSGRELAQDPWISSVGSTSQLATWQSSPSVEEASRFGPQGILSNPSLAPKLGFFSRTAFKQLIWLAHDGSTTFFSSFFGCPRFLHPPGRPGWCRVCGCQVCLLIGESFRTG